MEGLVTTATSEGSRYTFQVALCDLLLGWPKGSLPRVDGAGGRERGEGEEE